MGEFSGFHPEGLAFLRDLAENDNKAWFDEHRSVHETHVLGAGRDFVPAMGARLSEVIPSVRYEIKVGKSIGRINRDIRFSNDKTPYNTHVSHHFWVASDRSMGVPGFTMFLDWKAAWFGAEAHMFGRERQAAWQNLVAGPEGAALADIEEALVTKRTRRCTVGNTSAPPSRTMPPTHGRRCCGARASTPHGRSRHPRCSRRTRRSACSATAWPPCRSCAGSPPPG